MVQLTYGDQNVDNPAMEGMAGDAEFNDIRSQRSAAAINFGLGLAIAADGLVALPAAAAFEFAGISLHKHKDLPNDTAVARYEIGEEISLLRRGRIWVLAEEAVDPSQDVYLRHTVNGGDTPGHFRTDADTANADQIANAKWVDITTAAGLALLEINMP